MYVSQKIRMITFVALLILLHADIFFVLHYYPRKGVKKIYIDFIYTKYISISNFFQRVKENKNKNKKSTIFLLITLVFPLPEMSFPLDSMFSP
jgi:hypothetical protein